MADKSITIAEGPQADTAAPGLGAVYDPALDTCRGIDALAILASAAVTELGAGAEAAAVAGSVGAADTGVGTEALSLQAAALTADSGVGIDAAGVVATLAAIADTGVGAEGVAVLMSLLLAEVGHGDDLVAVLASLAAVLDTGAGVDAGSVAAALAAIADTGTGVDAILDLLQLHVYIRTDGTIEPLGIILLRGGREDIMPAVRESTEQVPGRDGEIEFGAELSARGLELRAASQGGLTAAQKTALKRVVAAWLRPALGVFGIAWEDAPDRYLEVRVAGAIQPEEYADYLEFTIPLKAPRPFYLGPTLNTMSGSGTATSAGGVEAPATVTIRGAVTNPSVTVAGATFTWTGTVGAGDTLVVDGERMTVTFNGANAISGFSGTFPTLQPGDNTITAPAQGSMTTTWRDRWI